MKRKHDPDYYMTVELAALAVVKRSLPEHQAIYRKIGHRIIIDQIGKIRKHRK